MCPPRKCNFWVNLKKRRKLKKHALDDTGGINTPRRMSKTVYPTHNSRCQPHETIKICLSFTFLCAIKSQTTSWNEDQSSLDFLLSHSWGILADHATISTAFAIFSCNPWIKKPSSRCSLFFKSFGKFGSFCMCACSWLNWIRWLCKSRRCEATQGGMACGFNWEGPGWAGPRFTDKAESRIHQPRKLNWVKLVQIWDSKISPAWLLWERN